MAQTLKAMELRQAVVCPRCGATGNDPCVTEKGRTASHAARQSMRIAAGRCGTTFETGCGIGCERGYSYECDLDVEHVGYHSSTFVWDDESPR